MKLWLLVRSFNLPLVTRIDRWLNEPAPPPAIIVGLDRLLRFTKAAGETPFQRRHCKACGGERLFALWFDKEYHCLRDLFALRQAIVHVGCMTCRTTSSPHFAGLDGSAHCNMCWSRYAFETIARRQNAAVAPPAMEAAMPATNTASTRRSTQRREEDSFAHSLPS